MKGLTDKQMAAARARLARLARRRKERTALRGRVISLESDGEELSCLYYPGEGGLIAVIHGGGFACGSAADEDAYCAYLADKSGMHVASLDYTLSYKRGYPLQLTQCAGQLDLLMKSHTEIDFGRLTLVGHSAGGNLAAALCLDERVPKPAALILNYPVLNNVKEPKERKRYPFTLSDRLMKEFACLYCADENLQSHPSVSPLLMTPRQAAAMPPTLIVKARGDKLAEDSDAFYRLLKSAGVETELIAARGIHGFIEQGMRKVFTAPGKRAVRYAAGVTDTSLEWLSKQRKN